MILYARAGERVYGTRTVIERKFVSGEYQDVPRVEDFHACTVRHDLFIGEMPDFPACLGDWQKTNPPVARHFIRTLENRYSTATDNGEVVVTTATHTKTTFVDLAQHGSGEAPEFGVPWSGESWWREYEHPTGGDRASLHYDLRFRGPNGTCTWRMDQIMGAQRGNDA